MGVVLIVLVAVIWSASTVLVQALFSEFHFERPFFLTYVANTCFVSLLPLRAVASGARACAAAVRSWLTDDLAEDQQALSTARLRTQSDIPALNANAADTDNTGPASPTPSSAQPPADSLRRAAFSALIVCPIWFAANYSYNASLAHTTVTTSTVLSSSSSAFTLLLSIFILNESFNWLKLAGVLLCWAGNALTVLDVAYGGGHSSGASGGGGNAGVRLLAIADAPHQTIGIDPPSIKEFNLLPDKR
jgi:solute carrier family 35 protein F5